MEGKVRNARKGRDRRSRRHPWRAVRRRPRQAVAAVVAVVGLAAAGFGFAVLRVWARCRDYNVKAYPKAYPECVHSAQSIRPKLMVGSFDLFLVLAAVAVYLWVTQRDAVVLPPAPPRRARRR
jgi:hypothetical protein